MTDNLSNITKATLFTKRLSEGGRNVYLDNNTRLFMKTKDGKYLEYVDGLTGSWFNVSTEKEEELTNVF